MQPFQPGQAQAASQPEQPMGPAQAPVGPQKVANLGFNQDVQNILLSRIEAEGTKNPNFGAAVDAGLTREAAIELLMILPELKPVFEAMGVIADGDSMGQPIGQQPAQASAPVNPGQMPFANRQAPQGAEEDSDNPLTDDDEEESAPSRGLTGY